MTYPRPGPRIDAPSGRQCVCRARAINLLGVAEAPARSYRLASRGLKSHPALRERQMRKEELLLQWISVILTGVQIAMTLWQIVHSL
jgi:hypothetical protein